MIGEELQVFFEGLVSDLRSRGVICAITSGLACVHYGIAESTKDCDLLCHPKSFEALLGLLAETRIFGQPCHYRGHLSPPLDSRWHRGGWTSHFEWNTKPTVTTLDVFGHALRESSPWEEDLFGLYAGRNVVAEMKRTDRDKDWPFINSLGIGLLDNRDSRGWLHLFEVESVEEMLQDHRVPKEMIAVRPVLQLAIERDDRLRPALLAERQFWKELDRLRIRICRAALRPYIHAIGRLAVKSDASIIEQHNARVSCAEKNLAQNPVRDYGVERMIEEARKTTAAFVKPELMQWLPDVRLHFRFLEV